MAKPTQFSHFWSLRGSGYAIPLQRIATSPIAALLAFVFARLGVRPNHVTVMSCLAALAAFLMAYLLPVERPVSSILTIWGLAQAAFLLDCADGLLARATGSESRFGEFLDHTLDIVSYAFGLAAVFVYVYRISLVQGEQALAHAALTVGFVFVVFRSARFFAWQKFGYAYRSSVQQFGHVETVLKTLMEFQVSMLGVLAVLVSPIAALVIFASQTVLLAAAYLRYIVRARRALDDSAPNEAFRQQ